jgi:hypothetical protein
MVVSYPIKGIMGYKSDAYLTGEPSCNAPASHTGGNITAAVAAGQLEQRRESSGRIGISVFTHTLIQLGMLANLV